MRRAARYDEAIEAAERARASSQPEMYLIPKALALRGKRDFNGALRAFDEAREVSGDIIHVAEKVRVLADAGRWAEAIGAWTELSEHRAPDAENTAEYETIERAALANAPPPDEPPLDIVRRRVLGHGALVPMLDATANMLRQVGADEGLRAKGPAGAGAAIRDGSINMSVSGQEGPTNRLCQALMFTGEPDPRRADYTSTNNALRRVSDRTDPFPLWRIDGDVVVQALAPPPSHVGDWIERMAMRERDGTIAEEAFESSADFLDLWAMAASEPRPAARARDLMAAIVNPRMPVIRVSVGPEWVYRWQVVAILGLVFSEPGWRGTEKREALLSLLRGSLDWPLAAAIRVATELALRETETTRELREELIVLTKAVKDERNSGIAMTLLGALEMLPYVPKEHVEKVRAILQGSGHLDGPETHGEPSPPPPPPPAANRPWWKFWS
jgi:hypothetical protein